MTTRDNIRDNHLLSLSSSTVPFLAPLLPKKLLERESPRFRSSSVQFQLTVCRAEAKRPLRQISSQNHAR